MRDLIAVALAAMIAVVGVGGAAADEQRDVDQAAGVVQNFLADPAMASLKAGLKQARAALVIWRFEPGFWGIGDDDDALLVVQREDGSWSHPAFYDIGDGAILRGPWTRGTSVVLLIMTDRALEVLLNAHSKVRLGAHLTVAVGPSGNAPLPTGVDVVSFARDYRGYLASSAAGIDIEIDRGDNEDYYGRGANPRAIVIDNRHRHAGADRLRQAMQGR
jgi:lipid-binding SYLF domain-containing protein